MRIDEIIQLRTQALSPEHQAKVFINHFERIVGLQLIQTA